jgi:hypothetical protein
MRQFASSLWITSLEMPDKTTRSKSAERGVDASRKITLSSVLYSRKASDFRAFLISGPISV